MKTHARLSGIALLLGVLGFVVFFITSAITGRQEVPMMAACISNLVCSAWFIYKHPKGKWYGEIMILNDTKLVKQK